MDLLSFAPQGSYTGFVYTYAVGPPMHLMHKTAGYLTSVFWAAIMVGRLAAIPLSYRIKPVRMLTFNQVRENLLSIHKWQSLESSVGLISKAKMLDLLLDVLYLVYFVFTRGKFMMDQRAEPLEEAMVSVLVKN